MKDPDDFPVQDEADRDIICLDCGTMMTDTERETIYDKYGPLKVCCNCRSGELEHRPVWRPDEYDVL